MGLNRIINYVVSGSRGLDLYLPLWGLVTLEVLYPVKTCEREARAETVQYSDRATFPQIPLK